VLHHSSFSNRYSWFTKQTKIDGTGFVQ
jgi:hypothetical protein